MFWGVHALGAARRTELCLLLLHLLQNADDEAIDGFFGDGIADTVKRVIISVFDGGTDALLVTIADQSLDGFVRWGTRPIDFRRRGSA